MLQDQLSESSSVKSKKLQNNACKFVFHVHLSASIIPDPNDGPRIYYLWQDHFLLNLFSMYSTSLARWLLVYSHM